MTASPVNVFVYAVMTNTLDREHIGQEFYSAALHRWSPVVTISHTASAVFLVVEGEDHDIPHKLAYDTTINLRVPEGTE